MVERTEPERLDTGRALQEGEIARRTEGRGGGHRDQLDVDLVVHRSAAEVEVAEGILVVADAGRLGIDVPDLELEAGATREGHAGRAEGADGRTTADAGAGTDGDVAYGRVGDQLAARGSHARGGHHDVVRDGVVDHEGRAAADRRRTRTEGVGVVHGDGTLRDVEAAGEGARRACEGEVARAGLDQGARTHVGAGREVEAAVEGRVVRDLDRRRGAVGHLEAGAEVLVVRGFPAQGRVVGEVDAAGRGGGAQGVQVEAEDAAVDVHFRVRRERGARAIDDPLADAVLHDRREGARGISIVEQTGRVGVVQEAGSREGQRATDCRHRGGVVEVDLVRAVDDQRIDAAGGMEARAAVLHEEGAVEGARAGVFDRAAGEHQVAMGGRGRRAELSGVGELEEAAVEGDRAGVGLGRAGELEGACAGLREAGHARTGVTEGTGEAQRLAGGDVEVAGGVDGAEADALGGDGGIIGHIDVTEEDPRAGHVRVDLVAGEFAAVERDRSEEGALLERVGGTAVERQRDAVGGRTDRIISGHLEEGTGQHGAGVRVEVVAEVDDDAIGRRQDARRVDLDGSVVHLDSSGEGITTVAATHAEHLRALLDDGTITADNAEQVVIAGIVEAELTRLGDDHLCGGTEVTGIAEEGAVTDLEDAVIDEDASHESEITGRQDGRTRAERADVTRTG